MKMIINCSRYGFTSIRCLLIQTDRMMIIFSATSSGVLSVADTWPAQSKAKIVYFARKNRNVIARDSQFKQALTYGDLSYSLIDHLSAFVEQVSTVNQVKQIDTHV